jgi:hypothetical protein
MLFSFEECGDDPLSERVGLGSFLDAVQEGGLPVGGWGFGEQVEVIGRQVWGVVGQAVCGRVWEVVGRAVCGRVWEVSGQVLWLQNCSLLFDKAFIPSWR